MKVMEKIRIEKILISRISSIDLVEICIQNQYEKKKTFFLKVRREITTKI